MLVTDVEGKKKISFDKLMKILLLLQINQNNWQKREKLDHCGCFDVSSKKFRQKNTFSKKALNRSKHPEWPNNNWHQLWALSLNQNPKYDWCRCVFLHKNAQRGFHLQTMTVQSGAVAEWSKGLRERNKRKPKNPTFARPPNHLVHLKKQWQSKWLE